MRLKYLKYVYCESTFLRGYQFLWFGYKLQVRGFCVCIKNKVFMIYIFQHNKFHWVANLLEIFNTLYRWQTASQVSFFVGCLNFVDQPSYENHKYWYPTNSSDFTVFKSRAMSNELFNVTVL